jgi:hypothetical protein
MGAEEGGRMVSVDDFLEALESALETAMGDEVEVDASEMSDEVEDEEDLEAPDEFAPEGEDVVADDEIEDEMLEGFTLGKSKEEKEQEKQDIADLSVTSAKRTAYDKKTGGSGARRNKPFASYSVDSSAATYKESTENTDALVEQITKRVAARILKAALAKK